MQLFETIDRLHRIHKLIRREATGTADEFAERLHLKRRQLYNILEEFKIYGADIKYDRYRCTYYYANDFEILVKISLNPLSEKEQRNVFAGNSENNLFCAIPLHNHMVTLYV